MAKLNRFEQLFKDIEQLRNLDKELLAWLAFYRWLERQKRHQFADLVRQQYSHICLKISDHQHADVLNLLSVESSLQQSS